MEDYIHIGKKIAEVLKKRHITQQTLGRHIGVTAGAASYLCRRETLDVRTLHKTGNALKYNFFKHFPVEEDETALGETQADERDNAIAALKGQLAEAEKQTEAGRQEMKLLRQENEYLKEINALLKKNSC